MTTRQDQETARGGNHPAPAPAPWSRSVAAGSPARADTGSGHGSPGTAGGNGRAGRAEKLPRPPRRRRPALAALAVLLIVGGAAVAGLLAVRLDDRATVLVAAHPIGAGQQITAADLAVAKVGSDSVAVIPASQAKQVVGRYAAEQIGAGRLIDSSLLSSTGLLTSSTAAVGVALKAGRFPAGGLQTGDQVQVVRVIDGTPSVLADQATVGSVHKPAGGAFAASSTGDMVVTVVVSRRVAPAVAAAAAADQISLVLLSRGSPAAG